jgi:hypothetical protein
MKHDIPWDTRQRIKILEWEQFSAEAFSSSLAAVRDGYIGIVQCCHVSPFNHGESGLKHLTWL